jgi:hypothetical protein
MSKPVESRVVLFAASAVVALTAVLAATAVGRDARAGVAVSSADAASAPHEAGRVDAQDTSPRATAETPARRLQCWQDGRLLIDAAPVEAPKATPPDARVVVRDRDGQAIVVTDAGRTTCITRPAGPTRPRWPMAPWAW